MGKWEMVWIQTFIRKNNFEVIVGRLEPGVSLKIRMKKITIPNQPRGSQPAGILICLQRTRYFTASTKFACMQASIKRWGWSLQMHNLRVRWLNPILFVFLNRLRPLATNHLVACSTSWRAADQWGYHQIRGFHVDQEVEPHPYETPNKFRNHFTVKKRDSSRPGSNWHFCIHCCFIFIFMNSGTIPPIIPRNPWAFQKQLSHEFAKLGRVVPRISWFHERHTYWKESLASMKTDNIQRMSKTRSVFCYIPSSHWLSRISFFFPTHLLTPSLS